MTVGVVFPRGCCDTVAEGGMQMVLSGLAEEAMQRGQATDGDAVQLYTLDTPEGVEEASPALPENWHIEGLGNATLPQNGAGLLTKFDEALLRPTIFPEAYCNLPTSLAEEFFGTSRPTREDLVRVLKDVGLEVYQEYADFSRLYVGLNDRVPPSDSGVNVVRWQDIPLIGPMLLQGDLRSSENKHTFHMHCSVPQMVHTISPFGVDFVRACCLLDTVFVHTIRDKLNLEVAAEDYLRTQIALDENPKLELPNVEIFKLGTNHERLRDDLQRIDVNRLEDTFPEYKQLTTQQVEFVRRACIEDKHVPYQFICLCHVDPTKGFHRLVEDIESFLDKRAASGEILDEKFRFYFLSRSRAANRDTDEPNLSFRYSKQVSAELDRLVEKYDNTVVQRSQTFTGPARALLPHLMAGKIGLAGGAQDGLNMCLMEMLLSNIYTGHAPIAVGGEGAGLVRVLEEHGFQRPTIFRTNPEEPGSFHRAFDEICRRNLQVAKNRGVVERLQRVLEERDDSVVFSQLLS